MPQDPWSGGQTWMPENPILNSPPLTKMIKEVCLLIFPHQPSNWKMQLYPFHEQHTTHSINQPVLLNTSAWQAGILCKELSKLLEWRSFSHSQKKTTTPESMFGFRKIQELRTNLRATEYRVACPSVRTGHTEPHQKQRQSSLGLN